MVGCQGRLTGSKYCYLSQVNEKLSISIVDQLTVGYNLEILPLECYLTLITELYYLPLDI